MRNDYRKALEAIIKLCETPRAIPTKRQERIHDIAMEALGMTASQRNEELQKAWQHAINHLNENKERCGKFYNRSKNYIPKSC